MRNRNALLKLFQKFTAVFLGPDKALNVKRKWPVLLQLGTMKVPVWQQELWQQLLISLKCIEPNGRIQLFSARAGAARVF